MSEPRIDFEGEVKDVDVSPEAPDPTMDIGMNGRSPQHDVEVEQDMVALANRAYDDPSTWPETNNPEYEVNVVERDGHMGAVIFDKASGELRVVFRGTKSAGDIKQDLGFTVEADDEVKANYGGHLPTLGAANTFESMWGTEDGEKGIEDLLQEYADSGRVSSLSVSGHSLGGAMTQMLLERSDVDGNNMLEKMGYNADTIKAATYGAPTAFIDAPDDDNPWHVPPMFHAYQLNWDIVVNMAQNWAEVSNEDDMDQFLDVIPAMMKSMGLSTKGFVEGNYVNYGDSDHGGSANDGNIVRLQPEPGSQFLNFLKEMKDWIAKSVEGGGAAPFPFYHMMSWYEPAVSRTIFQGYNRDHSADGSFKKAMGHISDAIATNVLSKDMTQWLMRALHAKLGMWLTRITAKSIVFLKQVAMGDFRIMKKLGIASEWVLAEGRNVSVGAAKFLETMNEMEFVKWTKTVSSKFLAQILEGVQKAYEAVADKMANAVPDIFKMSWEELADSKVTAEQLLKAASEAQAQQHVIFADEITRAEYEEHFLEITDDEDLEALAEFTRTQTDNQIARDALEIMEENAELPVSERLAGDELFMKYLRKYDASNAAQIEAGASEGNARDLESLKRAYSKGWRKAKDRFMSRTETGEYDEAKFSENIQESARYQRMDEIAGRALDRRGAPMPEEDLSKMDSFWNEHEILRRGPRAMAEERFAPIFEDIVDRASAMAARLGRDLGPFFKMFRNMVKFVAFSAKLTWFGVKAVGKGIGNLAELITVGAGAMGNVENLLMACIQALGSRMGSLAAHGEIYLKNNWQAGIERMKQLFRGKLQQLQKLGENMSMHAENFKAELQALSEWSTWMKGMQRFFQGMQSMFRTASRSVTGYYKSFATGEKSMATRLWEAKVARARAETGGGGWGEETAEQLEEEAKNADALYEEAFAKWSKKWLGVESAAEGAEKIMESGAYKAVKGSAAIKETTTMNDIDDLLIRLRGDEWSYAKNLTTKGELAEVFESQLKQVYKAYDEKLGVFSTKAEIDEMVATAAWSEAGMEFDMFMELGKVDPIMFKAFLRNEIFKIGPTGKLMINENTFIGRQWKTYLRKGGTPDAELFVKELRRSMKSQRPATWGRSMPEPTPAAEMAWNAEVDATTAQIGTYEAAYRGLDKWEETAREFNEWLEDDRVWGEDAYPDGASAFDEDAKEEGELQDEKAPEEEEDPFAEPEAAGEMEADVTPTETGHPTSDTEAMKTHLGDNESTFSQEMERDLGGWEWDGNALKRVPISDAAKEAWLRDKLVYSGFDPDVVATMSSSDVLVTQTLNESTVQRVFNSIGALKGNVLEFLGSPVGNGIIISICISVQISKRSKRDDISWSAAAKGIFDDMWHDTAGEARSGVTEEEWEAMSSPEHITLQLTAMSEMLGLGAMAAGATGAAFGAGVTGIGLANIGTALGGVLLGETTLAAGIGIVFASLATVAFAASAVLAGVAFVYACISNTANIRKSLDNQIQVFRDYGYATGGEHDYGSKWQSWIGDYGDYTTVDIADDKDAGAKAKGLNMVAQQAFGVDMDVFLQLDVQNEYVIKVHGEHWVDNIHTHTGSMSGIVNRYHHGTKYDKNVTTFNSQNIWLYRMPQLLMAQGEAQNWLKKRAMSHPNEHGNPWYLGSDITPIKYKYDSEGNILEKDGQPETELIYDFSVRNWEEWCTYRPREGTNDPSGEDYATMKQLVMNTMSDIFHKSDIEEGGAQSSRGYGDVGDFANLQETMGITGGITEYDSDGNYTGVGTDYRTGDIGVAFLEGDDDQHKDMAEQMRIQQTQNATSDLLEYDWGHDFALHVNDFVTDEMMADTRSSMLQYVRHSAADPTAKFQSRQFIMYMATEYRAFTDSLSGWDHQPSMQEWLTMGVDPNTGKPASFNNNTKGLGVPRWQTVDIKFSDTYGGYDIITGIGSDANPDGVSRNETVSNIVFNNAVLTGFDEAHVAQLTAYLKTQVWTPLYDVDQAGYDEADAQHAIPILTNIAQVPDEFRAVMELIAYLPTEARSLFGQNFGLVTAMFLGGKHAIIDEYMKVLEHSFTGEQGFRDRDGNIKPEYTSEAIEAQIDGWLQTAMDNKATGQPPEAFQDLKYLVESHINQDGTWDPAWFTQYANEHEGVDRGDLIHIAIDVMEEKGYHTQSGESHDGSAEWNALNEQLHQWEDEQMQNVQAPAQDEREHERRQGDKRRKLNTGLASVVDDDDGDAGDEGIIVDAGDDDAYEKSELDWNRVFLMGGGFEAYLDTKYVITVLESKGVELDYEAMYPMVLEIQKGQDAEWEGQDESYWLGHLVESHREIFLGDGYADWMSTFISEGGDDGTSPDDDREPSIPMPGLEPGAEDVWERWWADQNIDYDENSKDLWRKAMEGQFSSSFNSHDMRKRQDAPNVYHPHKGLGVAQVAETFYNLAAKGSPNPTDLLLIAQGMDIDRDSLFL